MSTWRGTCCFCESIDIFEAPPKLYKGSYVCRTCLYELEQDIKQDSHTDEQAEQASPDWRCAVCDKPGKRCCNNLFCEDCTIAHKMTCEHYPFAKTDECCAKCGVHFWSRIDGTQHLKYAHNGKTYCSRCYDKVLASEREHTRYEHVFTDSSINDEDLEELMRRFWGSGFGRIHFGENPYQARREYGKQTAGGSTRTGTINGPFLPKELLDAFKLLGIEPTKDVEAIKKAFKAKALKVHPDCGGDHQQMVKLNKAKETALKFVGRK